MSRRFAAIIISTALLGILVGVVLGWSGKAKGYFTSAQTSEPKITSDTSVLRVFGTERTSIGDNSVLVLKLQNISDRHIKAYTIASGKSWFTKHYFFVEDSIAPNAVDTEWIPLSPNVQDRVTFKSIKELTIAAAFFADGSGQGDPVFVRRFTNEHAGMRDQINRILPCLQGLSSSLVTQAESAVTSCETEALSLPIKSSGRSSDYELGLYNTKTEIVRQLTAIKESVRSNNLSEALNKRDKAIRIFQAFTQAPQ
jgi:hypothetical protein